MKERTKLTNYVMLTQMYWTNLSSFRELSLQIRGEKGIQTDTTNAAWPHLLRELILNFTYSIKGFYQLSSRVQTIIVCWPAESSVSFSLKCFTIFYRGCILFLLDICIHFYFKLRRMINICHGLDAVIV